ncbi:MULTISPECIES: methyltransferase domain-containing protein [unclassified Mesorhizobium]|uniref:class I SAM-dependent methyltransferase n=2 Tax=Mesorhizobium TaxID=68287 RepID=UPI000FCC5388|nr:MULTISPECIES: methyltransferase domain-containing protein [unclassified Mesorhizobium]TGP21617.1 methyltransferase domain-containing protein [Mesorhizobium sp. M1D.F.Ca.ET.231.01.1.1]TGP29718.1 methyltransferase domain-containing protein [Mesorhizobium sp. M1D.F.Ca.ET.234.01.1.1]TGS44082.1 methyltransferase domain-containing protein [Mesorhizobium sp. M1D.F.Ca.ET.184.01.1.1]TGS60102.1 methyltransferase domain-containing protein [Mesorhizobium sp. M1D.F.Ca.ET.183.01.1.1]
MQGDFWMFFRSWMTAPLRVAAIAPSGNALARIITQDITPGIGQVIELGPGTGVFTAKLLERGVRPEDLTLVEYGANFATHLKSRFPRVRVLRMDASEVGEIELPSGTPVGAVISGLPLLSMPDQKVIAILDGAFAHLKPDGAFYQFTYGPRCPVARPILEGLGLQATHIGRTMLNVPPAAVYRISRRRALRQH